MTIAHGKTFLPKNPAPVAEKQEAKKPAKKKDEKDDKKPNAQEAHEAIRPTNIDTLVAHEEMSPKEKRMYKLIWSNTIESCMSPSKYVAFTACISSAFDGVFKYSTEKNVFPGWKIVRGVNDDSEYFDYYNYPFDFMKPKTS